ncbi:MAG: FAD-dependent oxidoreductase [Alphaproteobacteria bacterium]|mgnify:CR=1 FL=1|nr:FAD-dependent oxidoreductase [Alphaproteobacteria bacterium]
MAQPEAFDVVVLGSGQGGKLLAWHLARSGRKVAVVERRWVGGSCPAVACMPSKNELWSARIIHLVHNAARFGARTGEVQTDMRMVRQRKQAMIDREIALHLQAYRASGAELIMGTGRLIGPRTVEVTLNEGGSRALAGEALVINVGSHAAIPEVPGLRDAQPLTHIEALELGEAPPHLIVLGGGYTGIELAQAYRRFGSRVTIIEPGPQIMAREDPDVAEVVAGVLGDEGMDILVGAQPLSVDGRNAQSVSVKVRTAAGERTVEGSHILVATGRVPNTADIGLDKAGIAVDARGFIRVDERLATTAAGAWAIGECAGSPQFTHVSVDDFRIVRDNMAGGNRRTSDRLIPHVMFTDPPLAQIGLSEGEARRLGIAVRVARLPMRNVLRTATTGETEGFMKALVGANDDRILGFTMIGSDAGEIVAAVQTAMLAELPYPRLRDAVIAHLTVAEGLGPLFESIPAKSG